MLVSNARDLLIEQLSMIKNGEKPKFITIGYFTNEQFDDINNYRKENSFPLLQSNEIIYMGRHHYNSRTSDGYCIDDLVEQIFSALQDTSKIKITKKGSCLVSSQPRKDNYGNDKIIDVAVFEFSAHKPRSELFSVIPTGDHTKPK